MAVRLTRAFGLYAFFSVFLPGAALLIGLIPLLSPLKLVVSKIVAHPEPELGDFLTSLLAGFSNLLTSFPKGGTLIVFVILSLFVGFVSNMVAAFFEEKLGEFEFTIIPSSYDKKMSASIGPPPHEMFAKTLKEDSDFVEDRLIEQFIEIAKKSFPDLNWDDESDTTSEATQQTDDCTDDSSAEDGVERSLYTLVSGRVHMDGTGRSRTFQAVSAACRSMSVVFTILTGSYAVLVFLFLASDISGVRSVFQFSPDVSPMAIIFLVVVIAGFLLILAFARLAHRMKYIYIEYLIGDFVLLWSDESKSQDEGEGTFRSDDRPTPSNKQEKISAK